jgi:hypothetical protein
MVTDESTVRHFIWYICLYANITLDNEFVQLMMQK